MKSMPYLVLIRYAFGTRDIVIVSLRERGGSGSIACGAAQMFGPAVGHSAKCLWGCDGFKLRTKRRRKLSHSVHHMFAY
jgi:hypothetical protein